MSLAGFWGVAYWRRPYGFRSTEYTTGSHRGQDLAGGYAKEVPALRSGAIVFVGRSSAIGFYIVVDVTGRPGPDRYDIYCHMFDGDARRGGYINAGERIGRLALEHERPGTSWKGAHLHHVVSAYPDAGWSVNRPTVDPRPIILAALAAPAGGGGEKPFDHEEDDMSAEAEKQIEALFQSQFYGAKWNDKDGGHWDVGYGHFQVDLYTQTLIASLQGQVSALVAAVGKLAGGVPLNVEELKESARVGAKEALSEFRVEFPTPEQIADAVNSDASDRMRE